jgi:hypothetical protein
LTLHRTLDGADRVGAILGTSLISGTLALILSSRLGFADHSIAQSWLLASPFAASASGVRKRVGSERSAPS